MSYVVSDLLVKSKVSLFVGSVRTHLTSVLGFRQVGFQVSL